jgi:redox-sensing transcriptional repressor
MTSADLLSAGAARGAGKEVPSATVARLPVYLRALRRLADARVEVVSSSALAEAAGVGPAQLRKDLSYLGT